MSTVIVLNASYQALHTTTITHAIKMLVREVAVIHEADGEEMFGPYPKPKVLRLVRYVKDAWRYARSATYSRAAVLMRDKHTCAYCGKRAGTIDHVVPTSRGGPKASWLNSVAACTSCNGKKANRTPAEAGMTLRFQPFAPSKATFLDRLQDAASASPALVGA